MSFVLPRYNPRLVNAITFPDTGDEGDEGEPFVWFASFEIRVDLTVTWPVSTNRVRFGLGPLGIMTTRRT